MFKRIRRVGFVFLSFFSYCLKQKKYIYLTFDDGPLEGTESCYKLCKEQNVRVTFFMVGIHASSENGMNLVATIRNEYPKIFLANHSFSHANEDYENFYRQFAFAKDDFDKAQSILKAPFKIVRLPGMNAWVTQKKFKASKNVKLLCEKLYESGYSVVGWDIEWNLNCTDSTKRSVEEIFIKIRNAFIKDRTFIRNHLVLLMHDSLFKKQENLILLFKLIQKLKVKENYVFKTIEDYPNLIN